MGRSQVLYNRTKGRYKNRGQQTQQQQQPQGNATAGPTASGRDPPLNPGRGRGGPGRGGSGVRYGGTPAESSDTAVRTVPKRRPKYDESILLLNTDQPRYYSSTPKATDGLAISILDTASGGSSIDLNSMAATLTSLSLAKRLRLPSHLADDSFLEPPPAKIKSITIDKMDMEIEEILTKKSADQNGQDDDESDDDDNAPEVQASRRDEDSSIESDTRSARFTRSAMIASPGSVASSPRKKGSKRENTIDVSNEDAISNPCSPTSIFSDEHSYSVGTRTRVRILENGEVEVRQKGSTHGTTTDDIDALLEDTFIPQEAAEVPTPTAVDEANDQDAINEDIDALLLGDQAAVAPILPYNSIKLPANDTDRSGTFDLALESLRHQVSLTKPSTSEDASEEEEEPQQQRQQQRLNQVHISAFAPQALDSFDETSDGDNDDKYLVPVPESDFSYAEEVSSSDSESHIEEEESIDATLEKIQKVKEKMSKIDQAYKGINAASSDSYEDTGYDADNRGRGYSKQKKGGQEEEYLEDWLDDNMESEIVVPEVYDTEPSERARAQGDDDSCVSSGMSTVTRSTVVTKSTRTTGGDSRCWTVDSRGKLFESDEEEKRAEDLDAWLDSVIK
jgi:hypothetical protein